MVMRYIALLRFFHFFGKPLVYMTYSVQIDTETPCKNFFFSFTSQRARSPTLILDSPSSKSRRAGNAPNTPLHYSQQQFCVTILSGKFY